MAWCLTSPAMSNVEGESSLHNNVPEESPEFAHPAYQFAWAVLLIAETLAARLERIRATAARGREAWRQRNLEKNRAYLKEYRSRPEVRARLAELDRARYLRRRALLDTNQPSEVVLDSEQPNTVPGVEGPDHP